MRLFPKGSGEVKTESLRWGTPDSLMMTLMGYFSVEISI
jgi:hypothetical protein